MTVRLRILTGAHKGAELDLTPGDWSLGSDALCDIFLNDAAAQQATLRVGEDGSVFLLPGAGTNRMDGENVPAEGCALPHFACVQWGAVCAAVGPCDAQWPPLALPGENVEAQPRHTAPTQESAQNAPQGQSPLTLPTPTSTSSPMSKAEKKRQGFESHGGIFEYARRKGAGAGFSPARLVLVLLLLLALTAGGAWKWAVPDTVQQSRENIEAVLRAEGLKPSAFEVEEHMGAWTVRGVVVDDKKLQDASAALRGLGMVLYLDILSRQAVAEALEARITAEGARLTVTQRGETLRLAGYAYDAKSLQALLQPLEVDCQRVQVRQDVVFWQELRQPLRDSLAALKLEGRVRLTPGPYTIAMDVTALGTAQQEALRSLEREVADMARGISPLVRPVAATVATTSYKPQASALKASLCEQIRVKASPAAQNGLLLVFYEGRDYAQGAHLPNGMQVQEVRPEYVTLVQGDRLVYCPSF